MTLPPPPLREMGLLARVLRDWFTDATGQGYSIGRGLGTFVLVIFAGIVPVGVAVWMAIGAEKPTMAAWAQYFGALTTYIPAICFAAAGLIGIAGATDPGGAWWSRSNAPPTTTTTTTVETPPVTTTARTTTPGASNDLAQ